MVERARPKLPPGTGINGLTVQGLVGVGGFGTVYEAHLAEGRRYALKFIPLGHAAARALREFAILMNVRHRNLVQVVAMGLWPEEAPEYLWLQLGFVEGLRLDEWARRANPCARAVARKVLEVARGLAVAHEGQVVHRDVKEANVIVRASDGEAVLVDFGASTHEDAPTVTQGVLPPGTRGYVSPEALRYLKEHGGEEEARYRSGPGDDLYAMGVVLYRLLTGRLPFGTETQDEAAVISRPAIAPHLVNPRAPQGLSEVCVRLLEKEAARRYASAAELCAALEALLAQGGEEWDRPLQEESSAALTERMESSREGTTQTGKTKPRLRRRHLLEGLAAVATAGAVVLAIPTTAEAPQEKARPAAATAEAAQDAGTAATAEAPQSVVQKVAYLGNWTDAGFAAATPTETKPAAAVVAVAATLPKESTMNPSKKTEAKPRGPSVAARCTAAMLAAGVVGCGGSHYLRMPEPEGCSRKAIETMRDELKLHVGDKAGVRALNVQSNEPIRIPEGETQDGVVDRAVGGLPKGTRLGGTVIYGSEKDATPEEPRRRAFIRWTWAQLPGRSEKVPVCLRFRSSSIGVQVDPNDYTGRPYGYAEVVSRFNEANPHAE